MNKYDVSDYSIYDSALAVNQSYKDELDGLLDAISEAKSNLNDDVLMGPAGDNCRTVFGQLDSKVNSMIGNVTSVGSSLSSISSNYQSGDNSAASGVANAGSNGGDSGTLTSTSVQYSSMPSNPTPSNTSYASNPGCGFNVTTGNKVYNLSASDRDILCAVVSAESDGTADDALAVATAILNRCEDAACISSYGSTPVDQVSAPHQFSVWSSGSYKKYLNGNSSSTVTQAVDDALAGTRNHNYLSFRANYTNYSNNMISSTGNKYK